MALLSHDDAARLGANTVRPAIFLLIKCTAGEWVRAWSGVGPFELGADAVDTEGGLYKGVGEVVGLPTLSQLINGAAQRVDFTLSGVSMGVLRLVDDDADGLRAAPVFLGLNGLDAEWQPISAPLWLWEGEADTPKLGSTPNASDDGVVSTTQTVTVSVGSAFTGRRRPRYAFFTGIDQRARTGGTDRFCDRASLYANAEKNWP